MLFRDFKLESAQWITTDKDRQPNGSRHRWRHVVLADHIERIIHDLGPVPEVAK